MTVNVLNVIPPFSWADATEEFQATLGDPATPSTTSIDLITIPPGLDGNVLMVYQKSGFNNAGFTRFFVRYQDLTTEEAVIHFVSGEATERPYELVSVRLSEGGTLFAEFHRVDSGAFPTNSEAVVATILSVPGIQAADFADTAAGHVQTNTDLANINPSITSVTMNWSSSSNAEPFGHAAVSRFVAGFSGPPATIPTYQVGNLATYTDIIIATAGTFQLGFGSYVATATALSRSFNITNLTSAGSKDTSGHNSVFAPQSRGRSYAQIIG